MVQHPEVVLPPSCSHQTGKPRANPQHQRGGQNGTSASVLQIPTALCVDILREPRFEEIRHQSEIHPQRKGGDLQDGNTRLDNRSPLRPYGRLPFRQPIRPLRNREGQHRCEQGHTGIHQESRDVRDIR